MLLWVVQLCVVGAQTEFSLQVAVMQVQPGSANVTEVEVATAESDQVFTITATFLPTHEAGFVEVICLSQAEFTALQEHTKNSLCSAESKALDLPPQMPLDFYTKCNRAENCTISYPFFGKETFTLVFAVCDPKAAALHVVGRVYFSSEPFASGKDHPLRVVRLTQFHRVIAQVYACVLCLWVALVVYNRATAIVIQKWAVTGLLLCCFCEHCFAYGDWKYYELRATHHPFLIGASLLLNSWKNSVARALLLVVSLGYGVVKGDVGRNLLRITSLAFGLFASNLAYNVVLYFFHNEITSRDELLATTVPLIVLDAIFYYWALTGIRAVKQVLKELKWDHKLQVYERMTSILILSVILSVAWVCIEV